MYGTSLHYRLSCRIIEVWSFSTIWEIIALALWYPNSSAVASVSFNSWCATKNTSFKFIHIIAPRERHIQALISSLNILFFEMIMFLSAWHVRPRPLLRWCLPCHVLFSLLSRRIIIASILVIIDVISIVIAGSDVWISFTLLVIIVLDVVSMYGTSLHYRLSCRIIEVWSFSTIWEIIALALWYPNSSAVASVSFNSWCATKNTSFKFIHIIAPRERHIQALISSLNILFFEMIMFAKFLRWLYVKKINSLYIIFCWL